MNCNRGKLNLFEANSICFIVGSCCCVGCTVSWRNKERDDPIFEYWTIERKQDSKEGEESAKESYKESDVHSLSGEGDIDGFDLSLSEMPKPKRVTIDQYPIAQCQRLYGCIQAAASRLEDATKDRSTQQVSRLTKLIPRDPVEHIGKYIFI